MVGMETEEGREKGRKIGMVEVMVKELRSKEAQHSIQSADLLICCGCGVSMSL